jgi:hypothetical protein
MKARFQIISEKILYHINFLKLDAVSLIRRMYTVSDLLYLQAYFCVTDNMRMSAGKRNAL